MGATLIETLELSPDSTVEGTVDVMVGSFGNGAFEAVEAKLAPAA